MAKLRFTDAELDLLMESAYLVASNDQNQKKDEGDKKAEEFVKKFIAAVDKSLSTQIKAIYLFPPSVVKKVAKEIGEDEKAVKYVLEHVNAKLDKKAVWPAVKKFFSLVKEHKTGALKEARKLLCETSKTLLGNTVMPEIKKEKSEKLENVKRLLSNEKYEGPLKKLKGIIKEKQIKPGSSEYKTILILGIFKSFNCGGENCNKEQQICPDDFDVVPVARLFDALFRAKEDAYKFSTGVRLSVKAAIAAAIIILIVGVVKRYKGYSFKDAINPVKVAVGLKEYLTDSNTPWYGKLVIILASATLVAVVTNAVVTDIAPLIKEKFFDKEDKKEEGDKQNEEKQENKKKEGEGEGK